MSQRCWLEAASVSSSTNQIKSNPETQTIINLCLCNTLIISLALPSSHELETESPVSPSNDEPYPRTLRGHTLPNMFAADIAMQDRGARPRTKLFLTAWSLIPLRPMTMPRLQSNEGKLAQCACVIAGSNDNSSSVA